MAHGKCMAWGILFAQMAMDEMTNSIVIRERSLVASIRRKLFGNIWHFPFFKQENQQFAIDLCVFAGHIFDLATQPQWHNFVFHSSAFDLLQKNPISGNDIHWIPLEPIEIMIYEHEHRNAYKVNDDEQ